MANKKFYLSCDICGKKIEDIKDWFGMGQKCSACGSPRASVWYYNDMAGLEKLVKNPDFKPDSLWGYFDYLPLLDKQHIVSAGGEGIVPLQRWDFFERYARERYNKHIKVYAHRHDRNHATSTFKDLAGTVVASVLKENGIENYVSASTGNIGVAYSRYLAAAGISLSVFIPRTSLKTQEAEIGSFGQNVMRVDGDYHAAKVLAKEFAAKHNILLTGGNFDPMRLEAKKTMVYEFLRLMPEFPTVFMQAISGGSGPLGIAKSCKELEGKGLFEAMPRMILPQPNRCAPMAEAWEKAKANNFPEGWQNDYPVWENPETSIETLSTGNPTAYPALAEMVRESKGEIIASPEDKALAVSRLIAYETTVRIGPAAAITVVGFLQSLRENHIKEGDVVVLNIGEGVARSPVFMEKYSYTSQQVAKVDDCELRDRKYYARDLWDAVNDI